MGIFHLPWRTIAKEAFDRTLPFINFFCCLHLTNNYFCTAALTTGPSMVPTLSLTGDFVLVDRLSIRLGRVNRGDIVLLRSPENPIKIVAKRVTGIEGDQVTFLVDPNVKDKYKSVIVQEGCVWVQGDNVFNSNDSRNFGAVPYGLVCGRVFFRAWPFNGFGPLGSKE